MCGNDASTVDMASQGFEAVACSCTVCIAALEYSSMARLSAHAR